jgi:hypothetical protein
MKNTEDDEKEFRRLYDTVGNDPRAWFMKAIALFESGDLASREFSGRFASFNREDEFERDFLFNLLNIVRMLKGMAMECMLKAAWISSGEILAKDGRMERSLKTNAHDLYAMAEIVCAKVSIPISEDEGMVLARLALGIETGHYPTTTAMRKLPSRPSKKTPYLHKWDDRDEQILKGLVEKLVEKIH